MIAVIALIGGGMWLVGLVIAVSVMLSRPLDQVEDGHDEG